MYCIYHSIDLDGWMSAAIVKKALSIDGSIEMIGWSYGQPIPDLQPGRKVVMVDISFPMEDMARLASRSGNLIWIDHHKSAINDYNGNKFPGITDYLAPRTADGEYEKIAACELTWKYFFPMSPMPEIVRLLGAYDCFRHIGTEDHHRVFEFQYAARVFIDCWEDAYEYLQEKFNVPKWLEIGRAILTYEKNNASKAYAAREEFIIVDSDAISRSIAVKAASSESIKILKVAAVNANRLNPSSLGINYHADGYDVFMSYHYDQKTGSITVSVYNENGKVDCSKIAKARGGGGHAGAAGFRVPIGSHFLAEMIGNGKY